jgi:hypothetical protein
MKGKGTYTALKGQLILEFEFDGTKDMIRQVARIQDIDQNVCSHCNGADFKFGCRTVKGSEYLELICKKCHWKLSLSPLLNDPKSVYPRRKHQKTKQPIGPKKDGWHFYENEKDDQEEE